MRPRLVVAWLAMHLAACGAAIDTPPFRRIWPENRVGAVEAVLARIGRPRAARVVNRTGKPLAVIASRTQVVAYDLEAGRASWQVELAALSRPFVTADIVLVAVDRDVVALDVATGAERWRVPIEENFLGAAASADAAFLVFGSSPSTDDSRPAGALLCLDIESGSELWRIDADRALGAPAVAGDLVFVPWSGAYLSAFAAASGAETLRLRTLDDATSWVQVLAQGVFYGSTDGIYRLTARSVAGTKLGQTRYTLPQPVPLPMPVPTGGDGYRAPVGPLAPDGARLYWAPVVSDLPDLPLAGQTVYLSTGRHLFALSEADGKVRWASTPEAAPIASAVTEAGLLVVDAAGTLVLLRAADGVSMPLAEVTAPVVGAAFDLGDWSPPGGDAAPDVRGTVRAQLARVATGEANEDDTPFRIWAVQVLAGLEDPMATTDLVELTGNADVPEAVRAAAIHGLEGRTTGTAPLLESLRRHYDWALGTTPGPVAPIAHALAQARDRTAVPLLLEHLDDPATDEVTLAWIAQALGDLGDASAVEPLFAFLERYHADPALGLRPDALREAARGVLVLGGNPARARLEAIGRDPHALAYVRDVIDELVSGASRSGR